ncbi:hypothetical protein B0H16DRAFT_1894568 [Mycena metata]|uniref:Uncharacterized protein n=1 Tax=Mycena metata TaxID=1033252 RepID=A0AAD7HTA4_9AGAR|nr:hypothetical protein B0H16DRAFT_1894568 [Mycena metata]
MGPSPPSRFFLAPTLFFTLTHATVTVYTPTQVVFTTAPTTSGNPASPNRSSSRPTLQIARGRPSRCRIRGLVDTYSANLAWLLAEKYPRRNCAAMFGGPGGNVTDPQSVLPFYLTHHAHTELGLRGFLGISDSFAAVLWGLEYALQMAHSNSSGAMFHLGGHNVFYDAFALARRSLFLPLGRSLCHETLFTVFYGNKASDHDLAGMSKPPSAAAAEASFIAAGLVVAAVAVLARAVDCRA